MVTLRKIEEANFRECIHLSVSEEQKKFVAPNVTSLAQAWLYGDAARPFSIYAGDTMVGFLMLDWDENEGRCGIWRFMIDQRFQGLGYGREAMRAVLDLLGEVPTFSVVKLSYVEGNAAAEALYRSVGFALTGEMEDGEVVMARTLRA